MHICAVACPRQKDQKAHCFPCHAFYSNHGCIDPTSSQMHCCKIATRSVHFISIVFVSIVSCPARLVRHRRRCCLMPLSWILQVSTLGKRDTWVPTMCIHNFIGWCFYLLLRDSIRGFIDFASLFYKYRHNLRCVRSVVPQTWLALILRHE